VNDGELLWTPDPERVAQANITIFISWLRRVRGLDFDGYDDLWRWSVTDLDGFWQAIWDFNDIIASARPERVLDGLGGPGTPWFPPELRWFPGARLNYAEHVFRNARTGEVALFYRSEGGPLTSSPLRPRASRRGCVSLASAPATASPPRCRTHRTPSSRC
jgi:acetoacetyl-CoA synthetase